MYYVSDVTNLEEEQTSELDSLLHINSQANSGLSYTSKKPFNFNAKVHKITQLYRYGSGLSQSIASKSRIPQQYLTNMDAPLPGELSVDMTDRNSRGEWTAQKSDGF